MMELEKFDNRYEEFMFKYKKWVIKIYIALFLGSFSGYIFTHNLDYFIPVFFYGFIYLVVTPYFCKSKSLQDVTLNIIFYMLLSFSTICLETIQNIIDYITIIIITLASVLFITKRLIRFEKESY